MPVRTQRLVLLLFACLTAAAPTFAQIPIEIRHTFAPAEPGAARWLVAASDGNLYGAGGGVYGGGFNDSMTVFRRTPAGVLTVVRGIAGARALSESQGVLYGLSNDGAFRMRLDGSEFEILNLPDTVTVSGPIVRAPDGDYGTHDRRARRLRLRLSSPAEHLFRRTAVARGKGGIFPEPTSV